jgi:capsular polysaccharide biosynthesis protein
VKPPERVPRIRDYLRLLRDGWLVIVGATALSVGAGWVAHETTPAVYQATTRVFVVTPGGAQVVDAYYGTLNSETRAITVQPLVISQRVTMRTIEDAQLNETPEGLAGRITSKVQGALVDITVTDSDPVRARDTANALAKNLIEVEKEMTTVETAGVDLVLVDSANSASDARKPVKRFLLMGGAFGLAISTILVLAYGLFRDRVLAADQVEIVADEAAVKGRE